MLDVSFSKHVANPLLTESIRAREEVARRLTRPSARRISFAARANQPCKRRPPLTTRVRRPDPFFPFGVLSSAPHTSSSSGATCRATSSSPLASCVRYLIGFIRTWILCRGGFCLMLRSQSTSHHPLASTSVHLFDQAYGGVLALQGLNSSKIFVSMKNSTFTGNRASSDRAVCGDSLGIRY